MSSCTVHRFIPVTIDGIEVGRANIKLYNSPPRLDVEIIEVARDSEGNPIQIGGRDVLIDKSLAPGEIRWVP